MSRLPIPGSDDGSWGTILNDFLAVEHNSDGTHKPLSASKLDTGVQTSLSKANSAEQAANKGAVNGYAPLDGNGLVPAANLPSGSTTPDATTTAKGVVQLAGDLGGTATVPTVPGLANKADSNAVIPKTTVTTKGDMLAASAANTVTRVGVGTDGQVLTANSAAASGVSWATPTSGGGVSNSNYQVVTKNGDNTWPSRPVGITYVMWVGPGSPDPPSSTQYDIWIDTTP